jgi:natural product biosynthesis luciferase-like monooxygenase protein
MIEELPVFPLSFAQQRLWLLDQLNPGSSVYNLPTTLGFRGEIDVTALSLAFTELVRRHEILRTRFTTMDGEPVQIILPAASVSLPIIDVDDLSPAEQEPAVRRLIEEEAQRPFDLSRDRLLRTTLLKVNNRNHVLLLTMHHIITDGWSMGIMRDEIRALYSAYRAGQPSSLPDLKIQYADFAVWQRQHLSGELLENELNYWRKQLNGISPLQLPTDRPRPVLQTYRGSSVPFSCSQKLTDGLKALSQKVGVTLYMSLLAAFQLLLSRYSDQDDIAVGTAIAGRNRAETEPLIGFFVNTLVLRTDLSGELTLPELLARVKEVCLNAYAHQDLPFEKLVEELNPARDLSRSPLFQVMFVWQHAGQDGFRLEDNHASPYELPAQTARFDLVLSVTASNDLLSGSFLYNTDLFDRDRIERMARHFENLLQAMVEGPEKAVGSFRIMGESERRQILTSWNDTGEEYAQNTCVHQLFEAQVARTPEAIALCHDGQQLSYRELNEKANQLAHYLRELGVRPEALIGLCVGRSIEMVVGMLAILKAGGAYVPLDPEFPPARLSFIMADAGINVLLTQQELIAELPTHFGKTLALDSQWPLFAGYSTRNPDCLAKPNNAVYVIYTSGSTGTPKGVTVEHRNVTNFFTAMRPLLPEAGTPGVWLAVTSISFDISVLELLWTLAHGFRVLLQSEFYSSSVPPARELHEGNGFPILNQQTRAEQGAKPEFSLFYFAHDGTSGVTHDRYKMLLEGARFADQHGFIAVWTPERHFHPFGDLYPNPAVTGAALATVTQHIQIRAGSVVLPLHHVLRVAEEWAMVDNLSNGRVGVSFASGWHAADFVFAPPDYHQRKQVMMEKMEQVRRLWRGESLTYRGGGGEDVAVRVYPPPIQKELPVWLTAAGSPDTFEIAGREGCGILTHLLGQSVEELRAKIDKYRAAWKEAGNVGRGRVSLMLHSFVGDDEEQVKDIVKEPFKKYLAGSVDLMRKLAESLGVKIKSEQVNSGDMDAVLEHAFERYYHQSGLMGTVEKCVTKVGELVDAGVDEIACLIDFGVDEEAVLESLEKLDQVKDRSAEEWQRRVNENRAVHRGRRIATSGAGMQQELEGNSVTHLQCTPSLARLLSIDEGAVKALGNVKELLLGGEALPQSLVTHLGQVANRRVHNMYGPTETTIWSATHTLNSNESVIPIGKAVANTQIYILSKELEPQPIGVAGELYIGGAGVTRGYLHRPDLTAERFLPNPFTSLTGDRFYRTGDLGRFLSNGSIEYLGRTDNQVKVRGYRIELSEIECTLNEHSSVQESVVIVADENGHAEPRLVAYVVCGAKTTSGTELQSYLRQNLPEYMIPSVAILERLPLTPNGKIDRQALSTLELQNESEGNESFAAATTPIEEVLVELWRASLKRDHVGIDQNFFELGGHSLLAMQLIARVRDVFHIDLPLRRLFEAPTIQALSQSVDETVRQLQGTSITRIERIDRNQDLPLSFVVEERLRDEALAGEDAFSLRPQNTHQIFHWSGPLNVRALEQSLNAIVSRHEILRTTFPIVNGEPKQVIAQSLSLELPSIDLQDFHGRQKEDELNRLLVKLTSRRFDLSRGPLFRATLLHLGRDEYVVVLVLEHVVFDGWSEDVLLKEIALHYKAFSTDTVPLLPELPIQYVDYANWLRGRMQGEVREKLISYWRRQLEGHDPFPEFELPMAKPRLDMERGRGVNQQLLISPELTQALRDLGREKGVTLFMTLLAALKAVFHRYSGRQNIGVLTPTVNRNQPETQELIGWFSNLLVLRTDLSGDPTFAELLRRVREVLLGALTHEELPLSELIKELRDPRTEPSPPETTPYVFFTLINERRSAPINSWMQSLELPDVQIKHLSVDSGDTAPGLSVQVREKEMLEITIRYETQCYEAQDIASMSDDLKIVLERMVVNPECRLSDWVASRVEEELEMAQCP